MGEERADTTFAPLSIKRIEARVVQREEINKLEREDKEMIKRFRRIWLKEWEAQTDPFTAWAWWTSEEQRARRKAIYDQYEKGNNNGKELL